MTLEHHVVFWWCGRKVCEVDESAEEGDYPFSGARFKLLTDDPKLIAFLRAFSRELKEGEDALEGMPDDEVDPFLDGWVFEQADGRRFEMNPPFMDLDSGVARWFVAYTRELPPG